MILIAVACPKQDTRDLLIDLNVYPSRLATIIGTIAPSWSKVVISGSSELIFLHICHSARSFLL